MALGCMEMESSKKNQMLQLVGSIWPYLDLEQPTKMWIYWTWHMSSLHEGPEDIDHKLLTCYYAMTLWEGVMELLKITIVGHYQSLISYLQSWFKTHKIFKILPFYIMVHMAQRNTLIFYQKGVALWKYVINIIPYYNKIGPMMKSHNYRTCKYKDIWWEFPAGFFDGARNRRTCGCRVVIVIEPLSR